MKKSNIIQFTARLPEQRREIFDYAAYERRAKCRYRRAAVCAVILTAVESVVTILIGLCILASTMVFFTML